MIKLLSKPLLPESKVKTVFMSCKYAKIINTLSLDYNVDVIEVSENNRLDYAISQHADCNLLQIQDCLFLSHLAYHKNIVNYLTTIGEENSKFNIKIIKDEIRSPYPHDVKLNIKVIGDNIICNSNHISSDVISYITDKHINIIHVNQGYSACSCIVLNEHAIITDDESIYKSLHSKGFDALYINKGSVKLEGFDYGFIGGTCGMIDNNILAFTGKLDTHTNYTEIMQFLSKHNIKYIELSDGPLIDIGGIIPLFE